MKIMLKNKWKEEEEEMQIVKHTQSHSLYNMEDKLLEKNNGFLEETRS